MSTPRGPWIARALASLLPRRDREVIVGDLEERHAELLQSAGRAAADRRYVGDLLSSIWTRGPRSWGRAFTAAGARDGSDLGPALRRVFRRQPFTAAVIVLSLAGGIGIATAALVVREAVFVRPPPLLASPEELSRVSVGRPESPRGGAVPPSLYEEWTQDLPLGAAIAAVSSGVSSEVRAADRQSLIPVRGVTPGFFALLGVRPALGREIESATDQNGVVLSHDIWLRLFDGREDAIGETVRIGDDVRTVIGVMPERFWYDAMDPVIWRALDPAALSAEAGAGESAGGGLFSAQLGVVVRRPSGLTADGLREHLQGGVERYAGQLPEAERELRAHVLPVGGTPVARQMALAVPWVLGAAVFLTLIIACANAAVLIFAQWTTRERELALRASLGASRGRLVRQLLVEALLLAAVGGSLGLGATVLLGRVIARAGGSVVSMIDLSIDAGIFSKSLAIGLIAGVLTGLGPALIETGRVQGNPLRAFNTERVRQRWRNGLVTLEITLTVALGIVAGTLVDGYRRQFTADFGFDIAPLLIATVESPQGVPVETIRAKLAAVAGLDAVAAASVVPLGGGAPTANVSASAAGSDPVATEQFASDGRLFSTLGVSMVAGRDFTDAEAKSGGAVVVVNDSLAKRLFPGATPIGSSVWIDGEAREVVGVVANYSSGGMARIRPALFEPLAVDAAPVNRVQLLIRTTADGAALAPIVRREIGDVAPGATVSAVFAPRDRIAQGAREILASTLPLVPLIVMGLLLMSAGIYGVLAFAIARRARELATRVAMGAGGYTLLRLITAQTFRLLVVGSVLAVAATFALTRLVRAAGGGGSAFDTPGWEAFVLPAAIVFVVGMLASWIPARRALSIDPAIVLKGD